MQISPIKNNFINTNYQFSKKTKNESPLKTDRKDFISANYYMPLSFNSRLEYLVLNKDYEVRASSHFRRGQYYGGPSDGYKDVENTLKKMYENKPKNKMLIVGVGKGQEPFSLAASTYSINWWNNLKDVLELNCVDLGPKLTDEEVEKASKMRFENDKGYAIDSMKKTFDCMFTFKKEICDFVKDAFDSKEKTKWDTSIQEFVETCPDNSYDCVSMNNTLGYILSNDQINRVMTRMEDIIKPDGFLITDSCFSGYFERFNLLSSFEEIYPGIYQKKSIEAEKEAIK